MVYNFFSQPLDKATPLC
jgi:hypothetical protein